MLYTPRSTTLGAGTLKWIVVWGANGFGTLGPSRTSSASGTSDFPANAGGGGPSGALPLNAPTSRLEADAARRRKSPRVASTKRASPTLKPHARRAVSSIAASSTLASPSTRIAPSAQPPNRLSASSGPTRSPAAMLTRPTPRPVGTPGFATMQRRIPARAAPRGAIAAPAFVDHVQGSNVGPPSATRIVGPEPPFPVNRQFTS